MSSAVLFALLLSISECESMRTLKHVAVKSGGSVTIPCFYDKQYESNTKYWCKGYFWSSCSIVAYANTSGHTSVTDYPTQNMFTVELNSLHTSDTGHYWCAVEIGGYGTPDDKAYVKLTISSDPDMFVKESRLRGGEGKSVSVVCNYSAAYQNEKKQWCRFKDQTCYTVGTTDTSQNSAVQISDDGQRSFSVLMTGLKKSDAGWYWCSVGDVQFPVHLGDTQNNSGSGNRTKTQEYSHVFILSLISALLLLILIVACIVRKRIGAYAECVMRGRQHNDGLRNDDVNYGNIVFKKQSQMGPSQLPASPLSGEEVEYSSIVTSHYPTENVKQTGHQSH